IGTSSKSLNNQKTLSLPKKKKKRKLIAKAWQYFNLVGSFAVCQVEIVEDEKKNLELSDNKDNEDDN
ncbi:7323_t:CDS:2, partial [Gigaspora margarita]